MMADTPLEQPFLVGIDPAAESFTAALFATLSEGPLAIETFDSTSEGIEAFEPWLARYQARPAETLVCIENTGVYSECLCYGLYERSFTLALIAPLKIHRAFDQGSKNDRIDSQKIAEYGFRYRDTLRPWHPKEALVEQMKALLSTREQLVKQKTASSNALQALRRKVIQTPDAIAALEASLAHMKQQIKAIMEAMRRLIDEDPPVAQMVALVQSAPGAGLLLAAHLLVYTEAFTKAPRYRELAARLGICPHEHTSGTSVWRPARSRGYGPAMVRKLLHLAARSVVTHKASFKRYYGRKCAEGKAERLVLNNVANKLLRILCGMIRRKEPYMAHYQSINPRLLRPSKQP